MTIEERVAALEKRMEQIHGVLVEATMTVSNKYGILGKIDGFEANIEVLTKSLNELKFKLESISFKEEFTDEQLSDWFMKTALTTKEVKQAISQKFPEKADLTLPMVSNYIHGKIKDTRIREFLGQYLRYEANKKATVIA